MLRSHHLETKLVSECEGNLNARKHTIIEVEEHVWPNLLQPHDHPALETELASHCILEFLERAFCMWYSLRKAERMVNFLTLEESFECT